MEVMKMKEDIVLLEFVVLWEGWECDSKAWVMECSDGSRYLRMTNHGGIYAADIKDIEYKVSEYENVLSETRKAIELLNSNVKNIISQ